MRGARMAAAGAAVGGAWWKVAHAKGGRGEATVKGGFGQDRLIPLDELKQHTGEDSVWVSYKGNVFDVTEFLYGHPGGTDRLMMAAGGDVAPFFAVYTEHLRGHVIPFLQRFKIGHLSSADAKKSADFTFNNPYANDPVRHPDLLHCTTHPFNGEPRIERLTETYYTVLRIRIPPFVQGTI